MKNPAYLHRIFIFKSTILCCNMVFVIILMMNIVACNRTTSNTSEPLGIVTSDIIHTPFASTIPVIEESTPIYLETQAIQQVQITATITSSPTEAPIKSTRTPEPELVSPLPNTPISLAISDTPDYLQVINQTSIGGDLLTFNVQAQSNSLYILNRMEQTIYQTNLPNLDDYEVITKSSFLQSAMAFTISANDQFAIGIVTSPTGLVAEHSQENIFLITNEHSNVLSTYYSTIRSLSFSRDGELLAIASEDTNFNSNGITIWSVLENQIVAELPTDDLGFYVFSAFFIPNLDRKLIISAMSANFEDNKGGIYLWDIQENDIEQIVVGNFANAVAISPNGELVASFVDNYIYVVDIASLQTLTTIPSPSFQSHLRISDAGHILFVDQQQNLNLLLSSSQNFMVDLQDDISVLDIAIINSSQIIISIYSEEDGYLTEIWNIVE